MPGRDPKPVALGEDSRLAIGNFVICVKRATALANPQEISTTCNETQGFNTRTRGPKNCELSIEGQVRVADAIRDETQGENPIIYPPNLAPGTTTEERVQFWPDFVNAPSSYYLFPVAYVVDAEITADGEGVQTYRVQLKNQGPFIAPPDLWEPDEETTNVLSSVS